MPELGPYGFVRGARGNSRPYRDPRSFAAEPSRAQFQQGPLWSKSDQIFRRSEMTVCAIALNRCAIAR